MFELGVKAQQNQTYGNKGKFPNPESISVQVDDRTHNGIELLAPLFENGHGERRVETV